MNYGFLKPKIEADNYVLGGLGGDKFASEVLQKSKDWTAYLPIGEMQLRNGLEVSNCTAFGTLNAVEMLYKRKFGKEINFSDRFLGIVANTWPPGNDPHKVAEKLRKKGIVLEKELPFSENIDTLEEYYSDITRKLRRKGLKWRSKLSFTHRWVYRPDDTPEHKGSKLISELMRSPLGVSVNAWHKEGNLYVKRGEDNHWCTLYGYEFNKYWYIFDSYSNDGEYIKKLAWDYDFGFAKRYSISDTQVNNWLEVIKGWFN